MSAKGAALAPCRCGWAGVCVLVGSLALLIGCADHALVGRLRNPPGDAGVQAGNDVDFDGPPATDPAARPRVVYPLDGVVLGRNIGGMNLQWWAGDGNALFRVRLQGARSRTSATFFTHAASCPDGRCQLLLDDDAWLAATARLAGEPVTLAVDAVALPGGPVASSEPVMLRFTSQMLTGDLYWFQVPGPGYSGGSVMRAGIAERRGSVFLNAGSKPARGFCIGCHAVSAYGCKVTANWFDPATVGPSKIAPDRNLVVMGARDPQSTVTPDGERAAFAAWRPDGQRLLTVWQGRLTLRDGQGRKLMDLPRSLVGPPGQDVAAHLDWAPDGRSVVLTRHLAGAAFTDDVFHAGDLVVLPVAGDAFQPARVLLAGTRDEPHYYPSFSPDSRFVLFTSGRFPGKAPHYGRQVPTGTFDPYDQATSRLRLIPAAGGAPVELANANHGTDVYASWPRFWAGGPVDGLAFVVFSSKIDYGFEIQQDQVRTTDMRYFGRAQLWIAAIDLGRAATGADPSAAPFWFPAQRPDLRAHLGYWTARPLSESRCP